jgi:teichoic acid transport system ATP-binding protein
VAEASALPPTGDETAVSLGPPTIAMHDVHVVYRVAGEHRPRARDLFSRKSKEVSQHVRKIHAVRGVSLTAHSGEAIGLIGRNGSGKSTLMRAMAGLLPVTSGEVYASSQPALLGVGAALKPDVTGRRNVLLGGLALGLTKAEVEERMDEIIRFSDLEEFIDLPLKTYSSGMKARLLFSISTAIRPEILLVDEGLAVGDEVFRERSNERIRELLDGAGTVFLVSHALETLQEICNRAIWLDKGTVQADGAPDEVLHAYKAFVREKRQR